jgi:hypothetical protein
LGDATFSRAEQTAKRFNRQIKLVLKCGDRRAARAMKIEAVILLDNRPIYPPHCMELRKTLR